MTQFTQFFSNQQQQKKRKRREILFFAQGSEKSDINNKLSNLYTHVFQITTKKKYISGTHRHCVRARAPKKKMLLLLQQYGVNDDANTKDNMASYHCTNAKLRTYKFHT